jgi:hypothetical protein
VIPNEPKIEADMGIIYYGPGVRNYLTGPFNHYNGQIGIEIRGSGTQMFPKNNLEFGIRGGLNHANTYSKTDSLPEDFGSNII